MSYYEDIPAKAPEIPNFADYHKPALDLIDKLLGLAKARLRKGNFPESDALVWSMDWRAEMQSLFRRSMHFIEQIEASLVKCDAVAFEAYGTYVSRLKG